jgi:glutamyl-tRNA reductase
MHLYCLGLNHTSASLSLLEQLTLGEEATRSALARLSHHDEPTPISELILVSTCNRVELYAASSHQILGELEVFLSDACGVPAQQFNQHLYRLTDLDVARHLFRVAAGLDSLVVGEPQVLGQVTRALELARAQDVAGPLLNQLFQSAVHAGKRVRTETEIGRNPASISSLAASLAERSVHPISEAQVVILGAGEMADLAVGALRKRGATHLVVVNRTLERARALASRWNAEAATYEHLDRLLASADILISSTGAPHFMVSAQMVTAAMPVRLGRPLVLIDIAVPRDIDPDASQIAGVHLYDLDSLGDHVEETRSQRMAEVPRADAIVAEELARFAEYLQLLEMRPLIADMRQQAEDLRRAELERTLRRLPDLTESERERIDLMTRALVKKLLEAPTQRLRAEAACPHAPAYATVARTLFGLQPENEKCGFSDALCLVCSAAAG